MLFDGLRGVFAVREELLFIPLLTNEAKPHIIIPAKRAGHFDPGPPPAGKFPAICFMEKSV